MPGFLDDYFSDKHHNAQLKATIAGHFRQLKLPVPKSGQFIDGWKCHMAFLSEYGVVIRLGPEIFNPHGIRRFDHPYLLTPLLSVPIEGHRLEIYPGLRMGVSGKEIGQLKERLLQSGLNLTDPSPSNIGYLPMRSDEFPRGIPVALDIDNIMRNEHQWEISAPPSREEELAWRFPDRDLTRDDPYLFAQDQLYDGLRSRFEHAFHTGSMREIWEECRRLTVSPATGNASAEALLYADWDDPAMPPGKNYINQTAASYGKAVHAMHHPTLLSAIGREAERLINALFAPPADAMPADRALRDLPDRPSISGRWK